MNVLYIGGFFLPDKNAAAHRVINNAKCLSKLGYDVIFIGMNYDKKYKYNNYEEFDFNNYKIIQTGRPCSIVEWFIYTYDISKKAIEIIKRKKITNVICYNLKSNVLKKILKKKAELHFNIIGDITEWYHTEDVNIIKRIIKNYDSEKRMRKLNFKMDALILISDYLFDFYRDIELKIQIPPLVDLNEIKWKVSPYKFNKENINIVFCGTFGGKKDVLDQFILDVNNDNKISIHVIGETKEEYISGRNDKTFIPNNVYFYGKQNHEKCISFIKGADYTILFRPLTLSNKAGFSTKLVESITCRTPIITNSYENYKNLKFYFCLYNKNMRYEKKNYEKEVNDFFDYKNYVNTFEKLCNSLEEQ